MTEMLYHEKQVAGLCAVHALNTLMQNSIFTEIDLMQIAHEFDRREKEVMMASGIDSTDFLKYMAEDSGNVADDGNYSIQVIEEALKVWNLTCHSLTNPDMKEAKDNPLQEQAFICNLASHWLTIRKIGEDWYNFNSLLAEPQYLSQFYLSAFLDTLLEKGYTILCVRGSLPERPRGVHPGSPNWVAAKRGQRPAAQLSEEEQLMQAIAASLAGPDSGAPPAAAVHSAPSTPVLQQQLPPLIIGSDDEDDEDDELKQAIAMSLAEHGQAK
ncbi:ubiquitin interaction motif domain containing protein [Acanthamoeba castellanii str. Neff]|uniref:ubiquitinyl hydrolase 1 n=1 Tax=Acanthamoeba castellanii (strain ATCC 30010 / Neff) TaxID=1257118 RepID=L8H4I3_ACACF|nr:ubiquitin interaction motif domain containing protein [Acanthamoeba castellanii str. Neff]ELR20102.1 ubiquitin interaction motif domain containing protein [Acanthamoeba castellanii str. Neff]